jgi:hypothetical protein
MWMRVSIALALAALLLPAALWSQGLHDHHSGMHAASPYAGQEQRGIKALAPEQLQGLLAGEGLGMARAAELNHYPGPRHVLDLAAELALSAGQRQAAQSVFDAMRSRATALGSAIVAHETELDAGFAGGTMEEDALLRLTGEIAGLQGELRATHLRAHLAMRRLLTAEQVGAYDRLRGYRGG